MHHMKRHKLVKSWKDAATERWVVEYGKKPVVGFAIVQIEIPFSVKRRRDPHNYCGTVLKSVIDGLVRAGAFPDDTPEFVGHREPVLTENKFVVVTVTT